MVYYLAVYRFKETLQFLIKKESKGKYILDGGKANFSVFNKTITLRNITIHNTDTLNVPQHIDLSVPEIYFSFSSWKSLIFHKKLLIDSLAVTNPHINIHVHKDDTSTTQQKNDFRLDDFLDLLNKTSQYLNAHSLNINNFSFEYSKLNGPAPLRGSDINIRVTNFTKVDNNDRHVLASDSVRVSMGRQHWVLPDGIQEISFRKFDFSTGNQKAELDSFLFRKKTTLTNPGLVIKGDQFYFNSQHLPAIYQKSELNIDTLFCLNPSLIITGNKTRKEKKSVSNNKIPVALATADIPLFKLISVKFIDVLNGEFQFKKNELDSINLSGARRSNAQIYNLVLDEKSNQKLTTDSIKFNLKDILFYSRDSLSKLKISEFLMKGKDAVFKNVTYSPSEYNHFHRGVTFKAPELLLKDIDLSELLKKRLRAQSARLVQPFVTVVYRNQYPSARSQSLPKKSKAEKMTLFFRFLHHVNDLLDVAIFEVSDGKAGYTTRGEKPIDVALEKFNSKILLDKLFQSDSLVDVKHSIANLQWGNLQLTGKRMKINVSGYRLDGIDRRNWARELTVDLDNGTKLNGKDIYWEVFDWDVFEKTKDIQIDFLKIGSLAINTQHAKKSSSGENKTKPTVKDLPVVRIGKLNVNKINFNSHAPENVISFAGDNFEASNVGTLHRFFTWSNAKANLSDISLTGSKQNISVKKISLNTSTETVFDHVKYESRDEHGTTNIYLPLLKLKSNIQSSDFSNISVQSLESQHGSVEISSTGKQQKTKSKPLHLPALSLDKLNFKNLAVNFKKINKNDTLQVKTIVDLNANSIKTFSHSQQAAIYSSIGLKTSGIHLSRENLKLDIPSVSLQLTDGKLNDINNELSLASAVNLNTEGAFIHYKKDSSSFKADNVSISFNDKEFLFRKNEKLQPEKLISKLTATGENFKYKGKKISISAHSYDLNRNAGHFLINDFALTPNISREENFAKAQWQGDYIVLKGKSLDIQHFKLMKNKKNTDLVIQKIIADDLKLDVSRDKSLPFRHGIEKPMLTKLISKISMPVKIDSLILYNSSIHYNEFSAATRKWGSIPLTKLNAIVYKITNRYTKGDSLKVSAGVYLFNNRIRKFHYNESYNDSLSGFSAGFTMSPVDLEEFTQFSKPLAAISITKGRADTVISKWSGNKYAAYGKMNFHYRDLKIKVYNKKDTSRRGIIPAFETFAANLILPDKKKKTSLIYFRRDLEKSVFSYWVKCQLSGILSTLGIKKDRKYRKHYEETAEQFALPKTFQVDSE